MNETSPPSPQTATTSGVRGVLQGLRIVVVDDDSDARELLATLLTQRSAELFVADCAAEALEFVRREAPDVLISDIAMPEEDGYSLIVRVRALPSEAARRTTAIAVTAHASPADRARALGAGFDLHLAKPVDLDKLLEVLINVRSERDVASAR